MAQHDSGHRRSEADGVRVVDGPESYIEHQDADNQRLDDGVVRLRSDVVGSGGSASTGPQSGPSSGLALFRRYVAGNKGVAAVGAILGVMMLVGLTGVGLGVVQAFTQTRQADEESGHAAELKAVIVDMLRSIEPQLAKTTDAAVLRSLLNEAADHLEAGSVTDQAVMGELHVLIGEMYLSLEMDAEARYHLNKAHALRSEALGDDAPETIATLQSLAELHARRFEWADAVPLMTKIAEYNEETYGREALATLTSRLSLGQSYVGARRMGDARRVLEGTLESSRRLFGESAELTLETQRTLATAHIRLGQFEDAEALYLEMIELNTEVHGADHPATAHSMGLLGRLYFERRRYSEAEDLLREAIEIYERNFLAGSKAGAWAVSQAGYTALAQGRTDEGEALLLQSLRAFELLGDDCAEYMASLTYSLTQLYERDGRLNDEETMHHEYLAAMAAHTGEFSERSAAAVARLTRFFRRHDRLDEALELKRRYIESMAEYSLQVGAEPDVIRRTAFKLLVGGFEEHHDPERGLQFAERAYDAAREAKVDDLWYYVSVIGLAHVELGDLGSARVMYQKALDLLPDGVSRRAAFRLLKAAVTGPNSAPTPGG
ncbi:MAG: tetratricopeptide repeat protein [Planctomycetota bacterium]